MPLSREAADDVRAVAGGGGLQILGQLVQRGLSLLFTAISIRVLGTASYGIYRQVAQVLSIGGIVGVAGFEYSVTREVAAARATGDPGRVRGSIRAATSSVLVTAGLAAAVLVVIAPSLAEAFTDSSSQADRFTFLFRIGAPFIPLFALTQVLRFSTHPYRTMVPSVVSGHIVRPVTRFVFGVMALAGGFAVAGMVVSLALSAAAGLAAAAWYIRKIPTAAEREADPSVRLGSMVRFAALQGAAGMLSIQTLGVGIIILGLYRSNAEVGLFGIALSLLTPVNILFTGLAPIWAPIVTELYEKREIPRLGSIFQTVNRWLSTFGFPFLAALALQPEVFLEVLAGRSGSEVEAAVTVLALGHFFYIGTGPTSFMLSMSGHPGVNLAYSVASLLLYIVLGVLVAPEHGLFGIACVNAGVTVFGNVGRMLHVRFSIGVHPFGRTFYKPVVATLLSCIPLSISIGVGADGAAALGFLVLAALTYLVSLRLLGVDPQEAYLFETLWQRLRSLRRGR